MSSVDIKFVQSISIIKKCVLHWVNLKSRICKYVSIELNIRILNVLYFRPEALKYVINYSLTYKA